MPNTDDQNNEYDLWLAQEKKALADAGYQENLAAFDRLKNRTFALLGVSVTLCTGALAGAFSEKNYAQVCGIMSCGFMVVAFCCIAALYTSHWQTKNVEGDVVDLLVGDLANKTKIHGIDRMSSTVNAVNFANDGILQNDRQWLKTAWVSLVLTPLLAAIITTLAQLLF